MHIMCHTYQLKWRRAKSGRTSRTVRAAPVDNTHTPPTLTFSLCLCLSVSISYSYLCLSCSISLHLLSPFASILLTTFPPHHATKNGSVGLDGRLVDQEGYPRNDIDVYAVRKARNRIICKLIYDGFCAPTILL